MRRRCCCCFVALGTRGDVQPVALLAQQLQLAARDLSRCTLVTHAAHAHWLEQLVPPPRGQPAGVRCLYLSSLPGAVWHEEKAGSTGTSSAGGSDGQVTVRAELLQHCCSALGLQHPSAPRTQQQEEQQRLLLFNLFALEAFSIAEALRVPCCVAQPYLMPYSMPAGFQRRFERAEPQLAAALTAAEAAATVAEGDQAARAPGTARVTWKDVSHWMWPLFTERWGSWRHEELGLSPWPLLTAVQHGWTACTYAHTGGADACASTGGASAPAPAASGEAAARPASAPGGAMPAAVPVLYGLSPTLVVRPGFWPASVQLCGFWLAEELHVQLQAAGPGAGAAGACCWQCRLPAELQAFLAATSAADKQQPQQRILAVDFGSMGPLGLLRDAALLLHVLTGALQLLGPAWRCVLLTGGWVGLHHAHDSLCAQGSEGGPPAEQQRLYVQRESLACHHLLLAAADVLLHHGGSGTTAAALTAGVPQLVLPLQFDQFAQAERVSDLGCSPPPLGIDQLLPQEDQPASSDVQHGTAVQGAAALLAAQVQAARQPSILRACSGVKQSLAGERGLQQAAGRIQLFLDALHGGSGGGGA